jgi:hypothetical protein
MINKPQTKWLMITAFMLAAGGFIIGWWPLELVGILVGAGAGSGIAAVGIGLLLDIALGAPTGLAHYLYFPFSIIAIIALAARYMGVKYFFERSPHDTV